MLLYSILVKFHILYLNKSTISKHLQESKCSVKNTNKSTDRYARHYKSRHCLGYLSYSLVILGHTVQRNFFANSHASSHVSRRQLLLFSIPELNFIAHNNSMIFITITTLKQLHHLFSLGRSQC